MAKNGTIASAAWVAWVATTALIASACGPDATEATGSPTEPTSTSEPADARLVASGEVWGGSTTVLDTTSATPELEGGGVTSSRVTSWDISGDTVDPIEFITSDSFTALAYEAGSVDAEGIVKQAQLGWFDGTFHSYGDTTQAVAEDGPRWIYGATSDGDRAAWFESEDLDGLGDPWRLFTATHDSGPLLLATSEQLTTGEPTAPQYPGPALWDGRVYWSSQAPPDAGQDIATWSVQVDGSEPPRLEVMGATYPAATSAGIVVMTAGPDAGDTSAWGENERRVVPLGGSTAEPILSLNLWHSGTEPAPMASGDWVAVVFDSPGSSSEVLVGNIASREGYAVPLGLEVEYPQARVCDDAIVWTGFDADWGSVGIYRLALETGELSWLGTPTLMALHDCRGDNVLWTSRDGSVATTWVTTWS